MGIDTKTVPADLPWAEQERPKVGGLDQTSRSMRHHIGSGGKSHWQWQSTAQIFVAFSPVANFSPPTGRQGTSFRRNSFPGPLTPAVTTWRSPNVAERDGPRGVKEASWRKFSELGEEPEPSTAGSSPIRHLWPAAPCAGPSSSSSTHRIGS